MKRSSLNQLIFFCAHCPLRGINVIGKRVLITGATNGIGKQAALELAKMGAAVVIVGRDEIKTRKVSIDLKTLSGNSQIDLLVADLSSMDEIRRIADEYRANYEGLDVLLNNAGATFTEYQTSADGYEMTFALNHFSYYLLTNLLLDVLKHTAQEQGEARIINVSSSAHRNGVPRDGLRLDNLRDRSGFSSFGSYGASKFANVLFTYELARRACGQRRDRKRSAPGASSRQDSVTTRAALMSAIIKTLQAVIGRPPAEGGRDPRISCLCTGCCRNKR